MIAYKNLLVFLVGAYFFSLLKIIYHSQRPYWALGDIETYYGLCLFDYPMPAEKMFNIFFFNMYNVIMYFGKYSEKVNPYLLGGLIVLVCISTFLLGFILLLSGLNYIYQSVLTLILCFLYLAFVTEYDNKILNLSERLGFQIRRAKKLKFQMMMICIAMIILFWFIMNINFTSLSDRMIWIVNSTAVSAILYPLTIIYFIGRAIMFQIPH